MNRLAGLCITLLCLAAAAGDGLAARGSRVLVQEDGSLKIEGRRVDLFGIYIPAGNRVCDRVIRPIRCGSRAALALRFRIQSVVYCGKKQRSADGRLRAICLIDSRGAVFDPRDDLSAFLLQRGLAVARPDAPFEYKVLENIAREQGRGIWGFSVDSIN